MDRLGVMTKEVQEQIKRIGICTSITWIRINDQPWITQVAARNHAGKVKIQQVDTYEGQTSSNILLALLMSHTVHAKFSHF